MLMQLAPEQTGDQEARDHEEHVDADVASVDHAGVVEHHRDDRHRSQALDVAPEEMRFLPGGHPFSLPNAARETG